jgi:hypothetical protein
MSIARQRALQQHNGSIGGFLGASQPVAPKYSGSVTPSKPKKNYAKLNRERMRALAAAKNERRETSSGGAGPVKRLIPVPKNLQHARSKVSSTIRASNTTNSATHRNFLKRTTPSGPQLAAAAAAAAQQNQNKPYQSRHIKRKAATPTSFVAPKAQEARNFVRRNKDLSRINTAASTRSDFSNADVYSPTKRMEKKNYGKTPAYIHQRKAELAQAEEQVRLDDEAARDNGLVLMSEDQRVEVLEALDAKIAEFESALIKLPLVVETPGLIRKKLNLEDQISELAQAREKFSKPNVYIRADE